MGTQCNDMHPCEREAEGDLRDDTEWRCFPGGAKGKSTSLPMRETEETQVQSSGWEDALEEGMATHSSCLAWQVPWPEEPGGLQSIG